jgi:hypothetical protein
MLASWDIEQLRMALVGMFLLGLGIGSLITYYWFRPCFKEPK